MQETVTCETLYVERMHAVSCDKRVAKGKQSAHAPTDEKPTATPIRLAQHSIQTLGDSLLHAHYAFPRPSAVSFVGLARLEDGRQALFRTESIESDTLLLSNKADSHPNMTPSYDLMWQSLSFTKQRFCCRIRVLVTPRDSVPIADVVKCVLQGKLSGSVNQMSSTEKHHQNYTMEQLWPRIGTTCAKTLTHLHSLGYFGIRYTLHNLRIDPAGAIFYDWMPPSSSNHSDSATPMNSLLPHTIIHPTNMSALQAAQAVDVFGLLLFLLRLATVSHDHLSLCNDIAKNMGSDPFSALAAISNQFNQEFGSNERYISMQLQTPSSSVFAWVRDILSTGFPTAYAISDYLLMSVSHSQHYKRPAITAQIPIPVGYDRFLAVSAIPQSYRDRWAPMKRTLSEFLSQTQETLMKSDERLLSFLIRRVLDCCEQLKAAYGYQDAVQDIKLAQDVSLSLLNRKRALRNIEIQSLQGNEAAILSFAEHLVRGELLPKDLAQGREILLSIIANGSVEALILLNKLCNLQFRGDANAKQHFGDLQPIVLRNHTDGIYHFYSNLAVSNDSNRDPQEIMRMINLSASRGNKPALYRLVSLLLRNQYSDWGFDAFLYLIPELKDQLTHEEITFLGWLLWKGYNVKQDKDMSLMLFKHAALWNNKKAAYYVAKISAITQDGSSGNPSGNYIAAIQNLCDQGNPFAMYRHARWILRGQTKSVDVAKAISLLETAFSHGVPKAALYLAVLCYEGIGMSTNYAKSVDYFEIAAKSDEILYFKSHLLTTPSADLMMYSLAQLVNKKMKASLYVNYYCLAKQMDCCLAWLLLRSLFCYKPDLVPQPRKTDIYDHSKDMAKRQSPQNLEETQKLLVKWAAEGELEKTPLGWMKVAMNGYYLSWVKDDHASALRMYHNAGENGNSHAMNMLGFCHHHGKGVPVDKARAFHWFQRASSAGHLWGTANTGLCHENGDATPKSETDALKYFVLAAEGNLPNALAWAGKIMETGTPSLRNVDMAIAFYKKGARAGNKYCVERLTALKMTWLD
eukprot:TRINITY_DN10807_c0_g1_i1.p1 TRINITY_DN10807_c0_g1~~TRINITY_DN10807_c0_g1_i1.p1  ORF type:complete len:1027 (-),score=184.14 TRINITY_DN10807_c0_g1_i1:297-3377(-)